MDKRVKQTARAGYISKGAVYAITGILAFGAAAGLGSQSKGKLGVLEFLQNQPFGNVILGVLALGLLCYAFWRFYQSIKDPENIGSDAKGKGKRVGFFFSGLVYLGLAGFSAFQIFRDTGGGQQSGGGGGASSMLPQEVVPYVFYAIAIGLAIKSVFQFVKAYKGDFLDKFYLESYSNIDTRKTIKWLGYAGLISRGVVVGIVSYFFFRAADGAGSEDVKGTAEAFSFLQESSGPWLMGLVALGLICYGAYMFIMAKYRKFKDASGR
ncbi:DUF1206 domain-containing protein [Pricia sp. S334]|uniref:DUF1206 domain-containing protein n=1 Tax=Pricia mediterranea TaxID=3076079 RepID=A0ABU3L9K3_9FLAO|nr:DUF1206 domain-containing protein [Pricia sp. S334]MDT7829767.1 DUF1206 domain-containing protein [Pricia sp. S334]